MEWKPDALGRWHAIGDEGLPQCGSGLSVLRTFSVDPPAGDRCAGCLATLPKPHEHQTQKEGGSKDPELGRGNPPSAPKPTDFAAQVVFCGEYPFSVDAMRRLLSPDVIWCDQHYLRPGHIPDTFVIGMENFDAGIMSETLELARDLGAMPPRFLPQEGWLDEVMWGHDWWRDYPGLLNSALEYHPGIQAAHALHVSSDVLFEWPSTEAALTSGDNEREDVFSSETRLHALGYQITGMSRDRRWTVLVSRAVPELGLQEVANTIAMLVRLRKAQRGGRERYWHAIGEWEHDLSRLKEKYWLPLAYKFAWPTTEPF